jgi:single-stranded-DNA-specific exonuclease
MNKRWSIRETADDTIVNNLAGVLNIDTVLSSLLVHRGINGYEEARYFFRPDYRHLHDPFLMADMEKAILRIEKAIENGEKVLIYGDYDVDGTTAVALVYSFFKNHHTNIEYYIPDRYTEGYGISTQGIDYAAEHGFSLIIALDCGIKSVDKIAYANTKNIDFIIHQGMNYLQPLRCLILNGPIATILIKNYPVAALALNWLRLSPRRMISHLKKLALILTWQR